MHVCMRAHTHPHTQSTSYTETLFVYHNMWGYIKGGSKIKIPYKRELLFTNVHLLSDSGTITGGLHQGLTVNTKNFMHLCYCRDLPKYQIGVGFST
jgi:hypothetical protein